MSSTMIRTIVATLLVASLAACSGTPTRATAPSTDVNPITGSRGGSGSR